jgi:hypothetical protein
VADELIVVLGGVIAGVVAERARRCAALVG